MIISFILVTLLSDSGVILLGRNYMLVAISLVSQLSQIQKSIIMKIDGSKIIFGLGVTAATATAVIALYFSIR